MTQGELNELGENHSGEAVWIEFSDGGEGLYVFYGLNEDGSADFYSVDIEKLEIRGIPYGFDLDYLKNIRVERLSKETID